MKQIPLLARLNMFGINEASQYFEAPMEDIADILITCQEEFESCGEAVILNTDLVLRIIKPTILNTYDDVLLCRDENGRVFRLLPDRNIFLTRNGVLRLGMLLGNSPVAKQIKDEIIEQVLGGRKH